MNSPKCQLAIQRWGCFKPCLLNTLLIQILHHFCLSTLLKNKKIYFSCVYSYVSVSGYVSAEARRGLRISLKLGGRVLEIKPAGSSIGHCTLLPAQSSLQPCHIPSSPVTVASLTTQYPGFLISFPLLIELCLHLCRLPDFLTFSATTVVNTEY